jgi:aminopeptidase N
MEDLVRSFYQDFKKGWDYSLEVTVPEDLVVANGGKFLGKVSQNGTVTYRYRNIKLAWRIDICIARYGVLQDEETSLRVIYLPDHEKGARTVLQAILRSMQFFSKSFGPLLEFAGFTVIEVPDGYGSQTDVTCILQEAEAFKGNLHRLYHEISHLWNPPELDEHNSRFLTEGLACFLEYLLEEHLDNKPGSLQEGLARSRERFRRQCRQDPKYRDTPIVHYGKYDCTDASYTKGMVAFWILYRLVGEQVFLDIYRNFHLEYRKEGATLEDFIRHVKKSSEKELAKFFDEWIYGIKSSSYLLDKKMPLESILHLYKVEQNASADD